MRIIIGMIGFLECTPINCGVMVAVEIYNQREFYIPPAYIKECPQNISLEESLDLSPPPATPQPYMTTASLIPFAHLRQLGPAIES